LERGLQILAFELQAVNLRDLSMVHLELHVLVVLVLADLSALLFPMLMVAYLGDLLVQLLEVAP
jgi:hypothetical protein